MSLLPRADAAFFHLPTCTPRSSIIFPVFTHLAGSSNRGHGTSSQQHCCRVWGLLKREGDSRQQLTAGAENRQINAWLHCCTLKMPGIAGATECVTEVERLGSLSLGCAGIGRPTVPNVSHDHNDTNRRFASPLQQALPLYDGPKHLRHGWSSLSAGSPIIARLTQAPAASVTNSALLLWLPDSLR